MQPGDRKLYTHPEAGQFYVCRFFGPHPDGLPFFCVGRFYATEEAAVDGFYAAWAASADDEAPIDTSYARMEATMVRPGVFEEP